MLSAYSLPLLLHVDSSGELKTDATRPASICCSERHLPSGMTAPKNRNQRFSGGVSPQRGSLSGTHCRALLKVASIDLQLAASEHSPAFFWISMNCAFTVSQ